MYSEAIYIHVMGLFGSLQRWGLALSKGSSGHFFSFFAKKGSGKSECIAWFVEGERCCNKEYEGSGVYK